jgi:hypothetical protein
MIVHLPTEHEALSSTPDTPKKKPGNITYNENMWMHTQMKRN